MCPLWLPSPVIILPDVINDTVSSKDFHLILTKPNANDIYNNIEWSVCHLTQTHTHLYVYHIDYQIYFHFLIFFFFFFLVFCLTFHFFLYIYFLSFKITKLIQHQSSTNPKQIHFILGVRQISWLIFLFFFAYV